MARFCKNCGNKLNDNEDICLNCGVLIKKASAREENVTPAWVSIIIIIILCLIFVPMIMFFFSAMFYAIY